MKRRFQTILATLSIVSLHAAAQTDDAIHGAFDRMFEHAPAPVITPDRDPATDPLHSHLTVPVRDWLGAEGERASAAVEKSIEVRQATLANPGRHERADD